MLTVVSYRNRNWVVRGVHSETEGGVVQRFLLLSSRGVDEQLKLQGAPVPLQPLAPPPPPVPKKLPPPPPRAPSSVPTAAAEAQQSAPSFSSDGVSGGSLQN
jgi:hypothetical protein